MTFSDQFKLDPPDYILSHQKIIRGRPIAWEGAVRAKTISDADLQTIKGVDKVRPEQRRDYVEKNKEKLAEHFVGKSEEQEVGILEKTKKRQDVVQHQLVLLEDLITSQLLLPFHPSRCWYLIQMNRNSMPPFQECLDQYQFQPIQAVHFPPGSTGSYPIAISLHPHQAPGYRFCSELVDNVTKFNTKCCCRAEREYQPDPTQTLHLPIWSRLVGRRKLARLRRRMLYGDSQLSS